MRFLAAVSILLCALGTAPAVGAAGEHAVVDTLSFHRWQAFLGGRFQLREWSIPVPWKEDRGVSCLNDRLSVMGHAGRAGWDLFLKGASGCGPGRDGRRDFLFEQGHLGWVRAAGGASVRYIAGERTLRDSHRLFHALSDDAPFAGRRGEGVAVDLEAGAFVRFSARRLRFLDDETVRLNGGLPAPADDGDDLSVVRMEGRAKGARLGCLAVESRRWTRWFMIRADGGGISGRERADRFLFGIDGSMEFAGLLLTAECLRSGAGRWDEVEGNLIGVDPGGGSIGNPSGFVGDEGAIAIELDGLIFSSESMGEFGAVSGWRAAGNRFVNDIGETPTGTVETIVTSWWRHPTREATVFLDAGERGGLDVEDGRMRGSLRVRARLRGGLDATVAGAVGEEVRPWYALSVLDDGGRARALATVRFDDDDGRRRLSFLGSGWMNVGRSLTARGLLYLGLERVGYFSVGAEYRPDERFLFTIDYGTVDVFSAAGGRLERAMLTDAALQTPRREERITVYSRIWFGTL